MLKIPEADRVRREGSASRRGIDQQRWIYQMKNNGCIGCHQLGQLSTRTIPASLGTFASSREAWARRVQSGQAGAQMSGQLDAARRRVSIQNFADWTDRIAKGELPFATPPRPQGVERNIVVTLRDWMTREASTCTI